MQTEPLSPQIKEALLVQLEYWLFVLEQEPQVHPMFASVQSPLHHYPWTTFGQKVQGVFKEKMGQAKKINGHRDVEKASESIKGSVGPLMAVDQKSDWLTHPLALAASVGQVLWQRAKWQVGLLHLDNDFADKVRRVKREHKQLIKDVLSDEFDSEKINDPDVKQLIEKSLEGLKALEESNELKPISEHQFNKVMDRFMDGALALGDGVNEALVCDAFSLVELFLMNNQQVPVSALRVDFPYKNAMLVCSSELINKRKIK